MKPAIPLFFFLAVSLMESCSTKNPECSVSLTPKVTSNSPVIAGDSLKLSVTGVTDVFMYNWYGPNGFYSHDSAPALAGVSGANAGRYYVDVITKGGCVYSGKSDSILIGAPVLPCSLTNDVASIQGSSTMSFFIVRGSPNGGSFFIEATGLDGDAEIEFFGTGLPAAGIYSVQNLGGNWSPGNVHVSFTDANGLWYGYPGTVYVSVNNGKITVSSCNTQFGSATYGFRTTGSFQLTQQ